jgi:predicted transcriptional regulator
MRTTFTLDDDLVAVVQRLAKTKKQSLREVLNLLVRQAIQNPTPPKIEIETFALGIRPGIDHAKLNTLAAELDENEFLNKLKRNNP